MIKKVLVVFSLTCMLMCSCNQNNQEQQIPEETVAIDDNNPNPEAVDTLFAADEAKAVEEDDAYFDAAAEAVPDPE